MLRWIRKRLQRVGEPVRGRIHRISRVRGGELSIVVRFGIEEDDRAQRLLQGSLIEIFETTDGLPPKAEARSQPEGILPP